MFVNKNILRKKEILILIIVILLFLVFSYLSQSYSGFFRNVSLLNSAYGEILYILLTMVAVLMAPISTLPLLPIAVTLWGPNLAALFTIIGWSIGALLAFALARYLDKHLLYQFIDRTRLKIWGEMLPEKDVFWLLIIARIFLPVDILSYATGLFTKIHWFPYFTATIIGTSIFAFIFAYSSELPLFLQAIFGIIVVLIVSFGYKRSRKFVKKWVRK